VTVLATVEVKWLSFTRAIYDSDEPGVCYHTQDKMDKMALFIHRNRQLGS